MGDRDTRTEHREPMARGTHSHSSPSWSPPRTGSRWMGHSPSGHQPTTAYGSHQPSATLLLAHCSIASIPMTSCPASPLHPAPSSPVPPWPHVTYRVCSRDATSLTSKTITMAGGGRRGVRWGWGHCDGTRSSWWDLTLCSSVVGGCDALEALLPSRVPPWGVQVVIGGAQGCRGKEGGAGTSLTTAG